MVQRAQRRDHQPVVVPARRSVALPDRVWLARPRRCRAPHHFGGADGDGESGFAGEAVSAVA
jgi:hypothetical protein